MWPFNRTSRTHRRFLEAERKRAAEAKERHDRFIEQLDQCYNDDCGRVLAALAKTTATRTEYLQRRTDDDLWKGEVRVIYFCEGCAPKWDHVDIIVHANGYIEKKYTITSRSQSVTAEGEPLTSLTQTARPFPKPRNYLTPDFEIRIADATSEPPPPPPPPPARVIRTGKTTIVRDIKSKARR